MRLPEGVRRLLRLGEPARDVDDELAYHFERAVADLMASGLREREARREAERRFGDVRAWRKRLLGETRLRARAERSAHRVDALLDVVVHAVRSIVRSPALSGAVVLTLALGLGANVVMLSIVDRLLLSPPAHVERPEQVRRIMLETWAPHLERTVTSGHLAYPDYEDAARATSLAGAAAWTENLVTIGHGADAREFMAVAVTGGYFELLGARPLMGRLITADDTREGSEPVVVLGHTYWQRELGGAADVLGRTVDLGSGPVTIVGVAPPGLTSLRLAPVELWLPLVPGSGDAHTSRRWYGYAGIARLREDVPASVAEAELTAAIRRGRADLIAARQFDENGRAVLTPLLESRGPTALPETRMAKWLAGVSLVLLLIACVNVANLLLARVLRQRREIAVRLALGISRRRLLGGMVLEGVLLGAAGGVAALGLAHYAGGHLTHILLPGIAWAELGGTMRLLPLVIVLAVGSGALTALGPALQATRGRAALTLREAAAAGGTRAATGTRAALALVQAALSVLLLVGAGLFVRSFAAVQALDMGMRLDGVLYVQTRMAPGTTTAEERARLGHEVLERLRSHPLLDGAAGTGTAPLTWMVSNRVRLPGRDSLPMVGTPDHWYVTATPDYFRFLGVDIVRGRAFDERDAATGSPVAVVNETMARALWPDRDPVGACILIGTDTECTEVVGVARDAVRASLREPQGMQYYVPLRASERPAVVMVRPRPGVRDIEAEVRRTVAATDPRIRYVDVTPVEERLRPQMRAERLGATMFSLFGGLALAVAALGLYAVLAFDVSQRRRELGVRAALGAARGDLVRLVLRRAFAVAAAGTLLGIAAAAVLAPRLEQALYGTGPHDLPTYLIVAAGLLATAGLAGALPARRAAAVDPNVALRSD